MEPVPSEYVYQISDEEKCQKLKSHFHAFFSMYCNQKFEPVDGLQRYVSGAPSPFLNVIVGTPEKPSDACIEKQLGYFSDLELPFVWYVDQNSDAEFKAKLIEHGFQDIGVFRGVIGPLGKLDDPEIPEGCIIELVETEEAMEEFSELVCPTFGMEGKARELYKKGLWALANTKSRAMFHWVLRKEGKVVSAISTYIVGDLVSFWNGASVADVRRQGLSTVLRKAALKHAAARGCHFGASYLMSEGLAFGICSKFGFETKWNFNAFLSPQK